MTPALLRLQIDESDARGNFLRAQLAVAEARPLARPLRERMLQERERQYERAICKIRAQERGWEPAYRRLMDAGAPERVSGEEPAAWIARVLPMFRRVSHPGNHAYVWRWDAKIPSRPYPRRAMQ